MSYDIQSHCAKIAELSTEGMPFAVITLVDIRGSAPQVQGAKAVVTTEGIASGTIGGGRIEATAIEHAVQLLKRCDGRRCDFVVWNLQTDIGMTCGGEVKLFFDLHVCNDWRIALFGAGHIAQSLVPILLAMQCRLTWIDQRQEWLDKLPEHPRLQKVCSQDLPAQVAGQDPQSFFVLMTQGHATDLPVLAEILQSRQAPYVGVLGSLQKAKVLRRDLQEMGIDEEKRNSFFCPMGLSLGNNTPPEIAISVVSQLIQERDRIGIIQQRTKRF